MHIDDSTREGHICRGRTTAPLLVYEYMAVEKRAVIAEFGDLT